MEQEKTLKVTKSEAREWYKSGNQALIEIALKLFKKEELETASVEDIIDYILSNPNIYKLTDIQRIQINALKSRKNGNISANKLLRLYALYYNKGWSKKLGDVGYFIAEKDTAFSTEWKVISHTSVIYPGLAYFKNEADARKVIDTLSEDMLNRLYTDL